MAKQKYFGTDGIRGKVGEYPITPDFIQKLGWAAGCVLSSRGTKSVIIGKDTRISGYILESALASGLSAAGVSSIFTGPMPTPAIAYLTRTFRAEAGIVISASHNPYYDNGIKFFSAQGTKLADEVELAIEAQLNEPFTCVSSDKLGKSSRINDAQGRYIEFCKGTFPSRYSLQKLKIIVDCAHGATYHIAPHVFKELGAKVISIGCKPNGLNINDKVGATNVELLQKTVIAEKADLGIALDGDGDRLIMVDHLGNKVDGDQIIYIIASDLYKRNQLHGKGVVGTLMSNMALEVGLAKIGIPFIRAGVGDRYVMEKLVEHNWRIGAENSGHVILLDKNTTGDGIVSALQVLTAIINSNESLYQLAQSMTLFPQFLENVRFKGGTDPLQETSVQVKVQEIEQLLGNKGRILLRKSGTEPLIRVMVEADLPKEEVHRYALAIADAVKNCN